MKTPAPYLLSSALLVLAASCGVVPRQSSPGDTGIPMPRPATPVMRIVQEQSEIRARVYRAGPLAGFGHNHVISWKAGGWISEAPTLARSAFAIEVLLEQAEVDDPGQRAQEGAEFAGAVPAEARARTRRNLLGERVLDTAHHARMSIRSVAIDESGALPVARVLVSVAGHETSRSVPFAIERSPGEVRASGELKLKQSELGLVPFSILLGALQVRDEIEVKFNLVARRQSAAPSSTSSVPSGARICATGRPRRAGGSRDSGSMPAARRVAILASRSSPSNTSADSRICRGSCNPTLMESLMQQMRGRSASGSSMPTNPRP
ncbi:MAG: YceI family protein, partial [Proteobacteria bacterium]|nr:YceI family protein [Pseudomonadota bacterium]